MRNLTIGDLRKRTGLKNFEDFEYIVKNRKYRSVKKTKNERLSDYMRNVDKLLDDILKNNYIKTMINKINKMDVGDTLKLDFMRKREVVYIFSGRKIVRNVIIGTLNTTELMRNIFKSVRTSRDKRIVLKVITSRYDISINGLDRTDSEKYYTLNNEFMNSLDEGDGDGEYYLGDYSTDQIRSVTIMVKDKKGYQNREGGMFPYLVINNKYTRMIEYILERYQIYLDNEESIDKMNKSDNCLIHALKLANVSEEKVNKLSLLCKSSVVPLSTLKKFVEENDLSISLKTKDKTIQLGEKNKDLIKIGLLENHYFLNDEVEITNYSIKNYDDIKREDEWWLISSSVVNNKKTYYKRNGKNDSFKLIKNLLDSVLIEKIQLNNKTIDVLERGRLELDLEKINIDNSSDEYEKTVEYDDDGIMIDKSRLYRLKMIEKLKSSDYGKKILRQDKDPFGDFKIAFDFETTTNGKIHKPYLMCYRIYYNDESITKTSTLFGELCGEDFLKEVTKKLYKIIDKKLEDYGCEFKRDEYREKSDIIRALYKFTLYAHNITYDINFLVKHVKNYKPIIRGGNKVCGGSFRYYGIEFNMKDTFAILNCALNKAGDNFGIKQEKEVIPYEVYTEESVELDSYKITKALKYVKEKDINQFKENIKRWNLERDEGFYDHIEYSKRYCEIDIEVMMSAYFIFKGWVRDQFKINLDNILTISSLADTYFRNEGCYDDCYKLHGIAQYFIQKTVVGGRCMARENKMYNIDIKLNDFDGVSLYPSAMDRLGKIGGYLKGTPKLIKEKNLNMGFLNKCDGYFVLIRVKRVGKEQVFPLMSYINEKGIRNFSNDMVGRTMVIDKISLEDLINFQKVEFDILKGYYFNEGRNNKIIDVINYCFNKRLEFKKQKNKVESLYKLIMNSSYGKTILKEQNFKLDYVDSEDDMFKTIIKNHNHIMNVEKLHNCDKYLIKSRKIGGHKNMCQIGSEILSMSKRIMNEVMCLAEDNECNIYYQDTDSMHIEDDKIEKLSDKFKEKYNRELIGESLGQFHNDFEKLPFVDDNGKGIQAKHSLRTIILGKKSYIDEIYFDYVLDGKRVEQTKYHFRMKGIPSDVIEKKSEYGRFEGSVWNIYEKWFNGEPITLNLAKIRPSFKSNKNMTINTCYDFKRKIQFEDGKVIDDEYEFSENENYENIEIEDL